MRVSDLNAFKVKVNSKQNKFFIQNRMETLYSGREENLKIWRGKLGQRGELRSKFSSPQFANETDNFLMIFFS